MSHLGDCAGRYPGNIAFVDIETRIKDNKILDIGCLRGDNATFHGTSKDELIRFLGNVDYVCGHNIVNHDAKILFGDMECSWKFVDTLYMSPLLFPEHPYHHLVKDYKLASELSNNPLADCIKTRDLLYDEINRWKNLEPERQLIFATLLRGQATFDGFLSLTGCNALECDIVPLIKEVYKDKICSNADIETQITSHPCATAYALALIDTSDRRSLTPGWVLHNFPETEGVLAILRDKRCSAACPYCKRKLDVTKNLKRYFGYDTFRTYDGEPLQKNAAEAAANGRSILAIFPTGGGKSLTFQLPALMAGENVHGLTVVISPLQSLMKDQVDNLIAKGITDAVAINGLLDPLSRSLAIERTLQGDVSLLYISPEMLRSKTLESILMHRHVVRFVIDEAHCFSSWGHDFRVDYLYIGKFIKEYQQKKKTTDPIAVSCFTATAKQKVIQDIKDYFRQTLNLELELFATSAARTNLRYSVIHVGNDSEKYQKLRTLVAEANCPTIVYVSRTKRTFKLAEKLSRDGFKALPFNGRMEAEDKVANQNAFMTDRVQIIVATTAFGMGVDKKDVGLVVHFDISDSLENYVQESGRAGRDPAINANCYVLYCDSDLDKHFILLNQTKLSISEIQQVWKAVKDLTRQRPNVSCSALEIARQAGWDDTVSDIETRIRTALSALEQSGYLVRKSNVPHIYATGITVRNMEEARQRLSSSVLFEKDEIEKAVRIIKSLISQKYISKAHNALAESRIDYLADILALSKKEVISKVERMRQDGLLADSKDISAYLPDNGSSVRKSQNILERFARLERFVLSHFPDSTWVISCKQLNEEAIKTGISTSTEKDLRTLLHFLTIKGYTRKKEEHGRPMEIIRLANANTTNNRFEKRIHISRLAVEWLYKIALENEKNNSTSETVHFDLWVKLQAENGLPMH